jgi:hypothetical protein
MFQKKYYISVVHAGRQDFHCTEVQGDHMELQEYNWLRRTRFQSGQSVIHRTQKTPLMRGPGGGPVPVFE